MKHRSLVLLSHVIALTLPAVVAAQSSPEAPAPPAVDQATPVPAAEPVSSVPLPEPPRAKARSKAGTPLAVTYDNGLAFATADGEFKAKLSLRTQFRFESTRSTEAGSEVTNRVYIPRSRLQLDGNIFGETNRYKIDFGLGDKGSFSFVKDLYVEKAAGRAWVRVGQWKRPFNRQELVSDFTSQFNERANTADYVGGGRDLGIGLHNDYEKSPAGIEWVVGVFNGFSGGSDRPVLTTKCTGTMTPTCTTGAPTNFPTDWGPTLVARVGWNSEGMKGYSEADLERGPLRYAVGASYKIDLADFDQGSESSASRNMSHGLQADAMLKLSGFSLELGGYMMKLKSADATFGGMAQAGYFVLPKQAEVAARFATAPTTGDRKQLEVRGAFNWYWEGHRWKWATDIGMVKQTGSDPTTMAKGEPDYQLRSMAQLTF